MKREWQLQQAKSQFSHVVDLAMKEGYQTVTRHGEAAVVIISYKDFKKLHRPTSSLSQFLASLPMRGLSMDLERDKSLARDIAL